MSPRVPGAPSGLPRWYTHPYNRPGLYRLAASLRCLPRGVRLELARHLGRVAARAFPVEQAAVRAMLGTVTGATAKSLDALALDVFRDFAMCFSDLVSTNRGPVGRLTDHVGSVVGVDRLAGLDGPVVSLTAHVGNWELAGRLLAGRTGRPVHVVVAEEEVPRLERWVRRDGDGVRFVARSHPSVAVRLVAALRRGEVVALQGDRALGTRGDVLVPFFGRLAPFPLGPFLLARASGATIVPAFCLLGARGRYAVRVEAPMRVAPGDEEAALRVWVALLEDVVRRHPTQWFNFFDVWHPFRDPVASTP